MPTQELRKNDFIKYLKISKEKIIIASLGIGSKDEEKSIKTMPTRRYLKTDWGYLDFNFDYLSKKQFILFVGGADPRRRIKDLVIAFNHLRATGVDIKLVLAGDCMKGPMDISTLETQIALNTSSYIKDIIFLGYVNNHQLNWLYANALCFVFPSIYEGFGLPVLEAMQFGCPVIAYPNEAVKEVAGNIPLYANNYIDIMEHILNLLNNSAQRDIIAKNSKKIIKNFSWAKTSLRLFSQLFNN